TLYVWAGDKARKAPDFVAVVEFHEDSPDYGKVIKTVAVPTHNNEAHHMHLSADGNVLAAGGLLSLLMGQDSLFFFDVTSPRDPKFIKSMSGPKSNITDDFFPLSQGGFLVTQMGSNSGGTPGRVAEFDAQLKLVNEWPEVPPAEGFNPHGISVRPEMNLMVTSDFVNPISTLNEVPGPMEFRNTVRVWDLAARRIERTITVTGAVGTMDVKLIPGDPCCRAFTAGMFDGIIYLLDTRAGTSTPVFDTATVCQGRAPNQSPQILEMTDDGTRLILPLGGPGLVIMLDVTDPSKPKLLSVVDLGPGSGPHDIELTRDDKRLIVTDYFLDQDDFGKVRIDGDRKVHVLKVTPNKLELDPRFKLDCNTAFSTGPARPHGIACK
ncbi:MAG TPA: selenium-binding protein SBP56-related protein, partial [Burkholderiaceae bacterium]|nr:selenium-binding protein SBP56-related protein [Burkholderiaceae bacterium]